MYIRLYDFLLKFEFFIHTSLDFRKKVNLHGYDLPNEQIR